MLFPGCGELNYARETGDVTLEATVSLFRCKFFCAASFLEEYWNQMVMREISFLATEDIILS